MTMIVSDTKPESYGLVFKPLCDMFLLLAMTQWLSAWFVVGDYTLLSLL